MYESGELDALADKLKNWSGVLLKAEPTKRIADKENSNALKEEKRFRVASITLILAAVGLLAITLLQAFSWALLLLVVTVIAGLLTGYLLFAKDIGITYRTVESFCNAGTGAGCGKVLRSEEGKLFGFITFSDLTLGYFAAQLAAIGLLVPLWVGSGLLSVLGLVSMIALPMIGYSIWLQAVKINEWCRLCLVVSGVLALQATIFGYLFYSGVLNPLAVALPESIATLSLFGLAGSSLLLLKQTVQQKNRALQDEMAAARIKNSPDVFRSLLYKQRQVDTTPFEHDFLIGKPYAPVKLTMAVNLYCGPCKNELEQAKELFSIYPEQVSLSLRFLKSGDNGETSSILLKAWLHHLRELKSGPLSGQVLVNQWYNIMDKKTFESLHSLNGKISSVELKENTQTHYSWIQKAEISKTPTTFMNGYELPSAYRMKDLIALIPGLAHSFTEQQTNLKNKESVDATV